MRLCVLDTETCGLEPTDQFVELASMTWDHPYNPRSTPITYFEELANPQMPISPGAKATHHLQERDLIDARPPALVLASMDAFIGPIDYYVAHNAPYDRGVLALADPSYLQRPWIDTVRCAQHIWPEAPGHSNQVLRYWLELEVETPPGLYPHRALYDVIVTAHLLFEMLKTKTPDELFTMSTQPAVLYKCAFGKHKGVLWKNVPKDYLSWVIKQTDMDENVRHTAMYYLRDQTSLL